VGEGPGPPPLAPFGLVLHHDGRWSHEGDPFLNERLRAAFDRSVVFLPDEGVYVVQLGRYRGQIIVEEAAFFVRDFDPETGVLSLSDQSSELLAIQTLHTSPHDGALLCLVKTELREGGLLARFGHAAQAELLDAAEETDRGPALRMGGALHPLPPL